MNLPALSKVEHITKRMLIGDFHERFKFGDCPKGIEAG